MTRWRTCSPPSVLAIGGPALLAALLQWFCRRLVVLHCTCKTTGVAAQISVVMKFGGSSLATAERMQEVADIVCSFADQYPCIVLSAMGKVILLTSQACPG